MWIIFLAELCWAMFTVFVVMGMIAQLYKPKHTYYKAKNVECVIVTIASEGVRNCLFECIEHHRKMFKNLAVLLDEGSALLPELWWLGVPLIIVPKHYRPDLVGKGRAMNYAIETHVGNEGWVCFLDDDNLVLSDDFLYEIPWYDAKGYVAMSPTIVPRKAKSTMAFVMDWIRVFDGIILYRLFTGLCKTPLLGLYGELLTVKWKTLKEIGFGERSTVEDFKFASQIVRRGYKTWQSASKVSVKSANSVKDLMRQRGRWYKGIMMDVDSCPFLMRFFVSLRMAMWTIGLFGSWVFILFWYNANAVWALPAGAVYFGVYIYGAYKADALRYIFAIPVFGIIECSSIFVGLKSNGFTVIDKS
jgi:cellulose synthase/poly-beta-1,6-N-acetylglucosamine synthase-like glycosyltransferase